MKALGSWFCNALEFVNLTRDPTNTVFSSLNGYFIDGNLLEARKVLFAVYLPGHWVTCVLSKEERRITFKDSLDTLGHRAQLQLIGRKIFYAFNHFASILNINWNPMEWSIGHENVPQQWSVDCGVFVAQFMEAESVNKPFVLTAADMQEMRNVMKWEILNKQFLPREEILEAPSANIDQLIPKVKNI